MAFPITVDSATGVSEAPGYFGPFLAGSDFYQLNFDVGSSLLVMFKSSDGGDTWSSVGSGPSFLFGNALDLVNAANYAACQSTLDPTQLFVVFWWADTGTLAVVTFDTGSDSWGTPVDSGSIFDSLGPQNVACCYRPADDAVMVLAAPFDTLITSFGADHFITAFSVYSVGGASFSAFTALDYTDYADVTLWDQIPCGCVVDADGVTRVFMQQVTRRSSLNESGQTSLFPGDTTFDVPFDCVELKVLVWGGGGGGGGTGGPSGGGGGGALSLDLTHAVTPGDTLAVSIGAGGGADTDGGSSDVDGVTAGGGSKGGASSGGSGGAGDEDGGNGGATDGASCGGGGGSSAYFISSALFGAGFDGGDASGATPGAAGTAPADYTGTVGAGGGGGTASTPGGDGAQPGGGGGGGGTANLPGSGYDGLALLSYIPFTNIHNGKLLQQSIDAGDAPGTLEEISEGAFVCDGGPIPFDVKAGPDYIVIAFSGSTTSTNDDVMAGKAPAGADPLVFDFQTFGAENSSSVLSPTPALAVSGSTIWCLYLSASSLAALHFKYRKDTGSGFGSSVEIGSFLDIGTRMCVDYLNGTPTGCFGTPHTADVSYDVTA